MSNSISPYHHRLHATNGLFPSNYSFASIPRLAYACYIFVPPHPPPWFHQLKHAWWITNHHQLFIVHFPSPPCTSSLLGSNTLLNSLLSNPFSLRGQVPSFTPNTKRLIILCYKRIHFEIFNFFTVVWVRVNLVICCTVFLNIGLYHFPSLVSHATPWKKWFLR